MVPSSVRQASLRTPPGPCPDSLRSAVGTGQDLSVRRAPGGRLTDLPLGAADAAPFRLTTRDRRNLTASLSRSDVTRR